MILKAQQMGFSLKQFRSVQRQNSSGDQHPVDCQLLLPMLQHKLTEIEQQLLDLQQQRL